MIKKIYKKIFRALKALFYLFYVPLLYSSLRKKIDRVPDDVQIFFLARMDFGVYLFHLHYAGCWAKQRGKVAFVILTPHIKEVKELAQHIIPEAILIHPNPSVMSLASAILRKTEIFGGALFRVFGMLTAEYPQALYIYYPSARSLYNSFLDERIKQLPSGISTEFLQAYLHVRKWWNLREETLLDLFHLHMTREPSRQTYAAHQLENIKSKLGIGERFVILNLNAKNYRGLSSNQNHRRLYHIDRYNCIIDALIKKGYQVVLQGRKEQPSFKVREGLIDYAKSPFCSAETDLALYSGAHFAIVNKTGPETFSSICNTPLLGLNYTEISCLIPHVKSRFFPKYVMDKRTERNLTWKEYLSSPSFFDLGRQIYSHDIEYIDISEEDMLGALEEFLPLVEQPDNEWQNFTPLQREFKTHLHPLHLDLYEMKTSSPCDLYLQRNSIFSKF